jgi:two-component sensor histidine kinase
MRLLGRNCRFLQGEDTSAAAIAEIKRGLLAGTDVAVEILNYRKDGTPFWNQLNFSPVHDQSARLLYHYGSQIDQTKHHQVRELEASEHRLLMEVDHRAKNVLALVDSIVRLSRADEPARYAAAIQRRVQSLARTHALLAEHHWRAPRLDKLLTQQLQTLASQQVILKGPDLEVTPLLVQPLGLVLNELAMNAVEHGSLSRSGGCVTIHWMRTSSPNGFFMRWVETGGPPVQEPGTAGFGLSIADGIVRRQLFGDIERKWKPSGLVANINVPEPVTH